MDKLIEELKRISNEIPLESKYNWDIPQSTPVEIPDYVTGSYQKNVYLKKELSTILSEDKLMAAHYWIIQEWGGIRTFKKNDRNDLLLTELESQLDAGQLTRQTFSLISSLSKVASFMKPDNYAIYDSRAIYALNWLLFTRSTIKELFPQPIGRNSELAKFDIQTIIRLAKKDHTYRSHKTAYHEYCKLLKTLSKEVYSDDSPYKVEMLLFLMAPTKTIEDIQSSVSLSVINGE